MGDLGVAVCSSVNPRDLRNCWSWGWWSKTGNSSGNYVKPAPSNRQEKKVISLQEPCIYACNAESIRSLYLHFSRAVTFESNVSLALNSLLMRVKAKATCMFWRLGESVQENPSLTLDGFSFATKNDSRFTLNGSPIHKLSSSVWGSMMNCAWHEHAARTLDSLAWQSLSVASTRAGRLEQRQQDPRIALLSDSKIKMCEMLSTYKKYAHHPSLVVRHQEPNLAIGTQHVFLFVPLTEVQS